jgi:hypothetical protein
MATPPAKFQLPVEIIGADVYGQQFFEQAHTLTIYRDGVSVLLANKLAQDSEVIVRNQETNVEAIASVLGQIRSDDNGQAYALAFLNPSADLWCVPFPATEAEKIIRLECCGCHSVAEVSLTGIWLEMYEAAQELARPCKTCKSSRVWRETLREVTSRNIDEPPKVEPVPTPAEPRQDERRKNRRTPLKASACIRYSGMEVVVSCEDVSKGGFRFTSSKRYPEGTRIEAAVPYAKFSMNIFSPATVVYCGSMPDGQFRHGVAYSKTSGTMGWDSDERNNP